MNEIVEDIEARIRAIDKGKIDHIIKSTEFDKLCSSYIIMRKIEYVNADVHSYDIYDKNGMTHGFMHFYENRYQAVKILKEAYYKAYTLTNLYTKLKINNSFNNIFPDHIIKRYDLDDMTPGLYTHLIYTLGLYNHMARILAEYMLNNDETEIVDTSFNYCKKKAGIKVVKYSSIIDKCVIEDRRNIFSYVLNDSLNDRYKFRYMMEKE